MEVNLISIKKAAEILDKPESTIRTWKRRGSIPEDCFFKIGGTVFLKANKFQQWVDTNT